MVIGKPVKHKIILSINSVYYQLSPLCSDDVVEVSPHEVCHHVHISELIQGTLRREHVQETNNLETEYITLTDRLPKKNPLTFSWFMCLSMRSSL